MPQRTKKQLHNETKDIGLRAEFTYTKNKLLKEFQSIIPDFTETELNNYVEDGLIDCVYLDDEELYYYRSMYSLLESVPSLRLRMFNNDIDFLISDDLALHINECARDIIKANTMEVGVVMECKLSPIDCYLHDAYCAYMPFPIQTSMQTEINLLSYTEKPTFISPPFYSKRTAYWCEQRRDCGLSLSIGYKYKSNYIHYEDVRVKVSNSYCNEILPHIAFTERVKNIALKYTFGIDNPMRKMKALYDYVTFNFRYSYVRNYSTIDCLADYCAQRKAGDCGSLAMLLVALYRYIGINARVVGGMQLQRIVGDGYITYSHDWLEILSEDNEWLPIDPFMGIVANQYGDEIARNFYFGNIDPFRFVSCLDGMSKFEPLEPSECLDPYDNQVGEIFVNGKALCFHEIKREFRVCCVNVE